MSTTTDILFNSPALHSLKRDQLVKLCKIHSVKAAGKNVELIARLKQVAETLPKDAPLSIAARSEDHGDDEEDEDEAEKENFIGGLVRGPRMESIVEESSSQGSLSSHRSKDFGTASSKSSVGSSIKAFASSFGLKRSTSAKSNLSTSTSFGSLGSIPPVPPLPANSKQLIDELSLHAKPYSSIPETDPSLMPQTDHFTFTPDPSTLARFDPNNKADSTPIPGHVLRPGEPAPENARLSLGLGLGQPPSTPNGHGKKGPTTTIRLISNSSQNGGTTNSNPFLSLGGPSTPQLKPWNTTFDLVLGSPGSEAVSFWPPRHEDSEKLYPSLPLDFNVTSATKSSTTTTMMVSQVDEDVDMPGALASSSSAAGSQDTTPPTSALSPSNALSPKPTAASGPRLSTNTAEPFVFGSPLPQHRVSNAAFRSAAADVLTEMNKRLGVEGVESVGTNILNDLVPGAHKAPLTMSPKDGRPIKPLRKSGVKDRFEKAHQEDFKNMEGIDGYLGRKGKMPMLPTDDNEPIRIGKKRKSSVLEEEKKPRRPTAGPVGVQGTRVISNGRRKAAKIPGGFDDDDEDEMDEVEERSGKKARVEVDEEKRKKEEEEERAKQEKDLKEREAIRRKLELQRARRRSSAAAGRLSTGRGKVSGLQKPPPKPAAKSRFGFLSNAAKTIVKGVWGGGTKKAAPAPPTTRATGAAPTSSATQSTASTNATKNSMGPPPVPAMQKSRLSAAPARPSTSSSAASSTLCVPSTKVIKPATTGTVTSLNSVASSTTSSRKTSSSRSRSPLPSFGAATRNSTIRSSVTEMSSAPSRNPSLSSTSRTSGSRLSSMSSATGNTASRVSSLGTRTSAGSRLLAPTASSLAKAANPTAAMQAKLRGLPSPPTSRPLNSITNALTSPGGSDVKSPPNKIFSKPLIIPPGSGIPSPVRSQSSAAAASSTGSGAAILRTKSGRKPRISRSKVIAKLASQRAASSSSNAAGPSTAGSSGSTLRPSLGAGARVPRKSGGLRSGGGRRSHAGDVGRTKEAAVLMSAKKRARQSEYARRRSGKPAGTSVGAIGSGGEAMDVDG
ncbi:hypothetical protein K435DRAFT_960971 [Dendrothele bispora CBS 962.96]|uniref:SAP domain-containing protein n=1 Tax=Dendrothele bispora (strain CBS 962.96) TaxID=1314807 RepID=A0A4S8MTJ4_DENBC|nr:hypothetical protein K435DRAFT_960971 [Dendrothele bispora CBS 962.96]